MTSPLCCGFESGFFFLKISGTVHAPRGSYDPRILQCVGGARQEFELPMHVRRW